MDGQGIAPFRWLLTEVRTLRVWVQPSVKGRAQISFSISIVHQWIKILRWKEEAGPCFTIRGRGECFAVL